MNPRQRCNFTVAPFSREKKKIFASSLVAWIQNSKIPIKSWFSSLLCGVQKPQVKFCDRYDGSAEGLASISLFVSLLIYLMFYVMTLRLTFLTMMPPGPIISTDSAFGPSVCAQAHPASTSTPHPGYLLLDQSFYYSCLLLLSSLH